MKNPQFTFIDPLVGEPHDDIEQMSHKVKGSASVKSSEIPESKKQPKTQKAKRSQPKMPNVLSRLGDLIDPKTWTDYFSEWAEILKQK